MTTPVQPGTIPSAVPMPPVPPPPAPGTSTGGGVGAVTAAAAAIPEDSAAIQTVAQARAAVARQLHALGLGRDEAGKLLLGHVFEKLGIDGSRPFTPQVRDSVRRYVGWLNQVRGDALVSHGWRNPRQERLTGALLAASIPTRHGAREGFFEITRTRRFWHLMRVPHLHLVAPQFAQAASRAQVRRYVTCVQKLLGNRTFLRASDRGRSNALGDLERTAPIAGFDPNLTQDTVKAYREALELVGLRTGTERGRFNLANRTLNAYERIRDHFYEPVGPHDTVWHGEALYDRLFGRGRPMLQAYDLQRREHGTASHCVGNGPRWSECRVIR